MNTQMTLALASKDIETALLLRAYARTFARAHALYDPALSPAFVVFHAGPDLANDSDHAIVAAIVESGNLALIDSMVRLQPEVVSVQLKPTGATPLHLVRAESPWPLHALS